jgi:hypothetical protein
MNREESRKTDLGSDVVIISNKTQNYNPLNCKQNETPHIVSNDVYNQTVIDSVTQAILSTVHAATSNSLNVSIHLPGIGSVLVSGKISTSNVKIAISAPAAVCRVLQSQTRKISREITEHSRNIKSVSLHFKNWNTEHEKGEM